MFQYELLIGTLPDAVILCVNGNDDFEYIKKSIMFIESIGKCKIIALVLFPQIFEMDTMGLRIKKKIINSDEIGQIKTKMQVEIEIPVYCLGDQKDECKLYHTMIDFF